MHKTAFRLARVAIVLVLAVGGFFLFIRTSHVDRDLLAKLAIKSPPVASLKPKPTLARSLPEDTNSEKVVRDSAKTDPSQTGLYEIEWASSSKSPLESGLLVQLLPDAGRAATAFDESKHELSTKPQLSGETLADAVHFSIRSIPGSVAQSYAMTTTSNGKPGGYAFTVLFRFDRVVITEIMESSKTELDVSPASSIAEAEYTLLQKEVPSFSMSHVTTPVVASVVYWAVALVVAAGAYFAPEMAVTTLERRRVRHDQRERDRERSQYRARGRRAVRRHAAPAWRQTGKR